MKNRLAALAKDIILAGDKQWVINDGADNAWPDSDTRKSLLLVRDKFCSHMSVSQEINVLDLIL